MELFIASIAFVAVLTSFIAYDEDKTWMESYDEAGRLDREYQIEKQRKLNE